MSATETIHESIPAALGADAVPPPPVPRFVSKRRRQAVDADAEVSETPPSKKKFLCLKTLGCPCCIPPSRMGTNGYYVPPVTETGAAAANDDLVRDAIQNQVLTKAVGPYVDTHCHLEEVLQTVRRHQVCPTLHKQVDEFTSEELDHWRVLGWAKDTDDTASSSTASPASSPGSIPAIPVWSSRWDQLTEQQLQAAVELGYDESGWNRNQWRLPRKTLWRALDDHIQRCLLALGETQNSWDHWNGIGGSATMSAPATQLNSSDLRRWSFLSLKEQAAATALGFTEAIFDCEELADLSDSLEKLCGPFFDGCVTQGCDTESIAASRLLAVAHPKVYASFGCHPKSAWSYSDKMEAVLLESMEVRDSSGRRKAVAWGEFGLDFSHQMFGRDGSNRRRQKEVFARQLKLALERGFPLVIHSRGADRDTLRIMRRYIPRNWPVHVHSFRGGLQFMEALVSGWTRAYIGVPGIITMRDTDAQAVVRACPLERMVLETDAPYLPLACSYFSHPGQIPQIIAKVAELKGLTWETVSAKVRANARDIYGF